MDILVYLIKCCNIKLRYAELKMTSKQAEYIIIHPKVTAEHVMKSLCLMDSEASLQMIRSIVKGDGRQAILLLQGISEEGMHQWIWYGTGKWNIWNVWLPEFYAFLSYRV